MKQIIIGKEGNQPFPINDPLVSRRHAVLNIDESTNTITLADNNSTNGTYIYNGQTFVRVMPNQLCNVRPDTMIQLGQNTRFHVRRLLPASFQAAGATPAAAPKKPEPKPKKRVDISHLRVIADNYNRTKMELESKSNTVNTLRSCTIFVSIICVPAGKFLSQSMFPDDPNGELYSWVIGFLLGGILLAMLMYVISTQSKKIAHQRSANDHKFAIKYACPECHLDLRSKYYENIIAEGKCPRCKTEFYDGSRKS